MANTGFTRQLEDMTESPGKEEGGKEAQRREGVRLTDWTCELGLERERERRSGGRPLQCRIFLIVEASSADKMEN